MHRIYTTKAIIVKSSPVGEANKFYFLLTKDFGFIKAFAQSVRLQQSKLKGHLSDFCVANISLVKGKEIWRITSAEVICQNNFLPGRQAGLKNPGKMEIARNIFSLLLRLLAGEEKNEALFDCIDSFYDFLSQNDLSQDNLKNLETITVLRILYHLGYFKESFDLSKFAENKELSLSSFELFKDKRRLAIKEINLALNETHL